MPNMANIVVQNTAAANVTYNAATPSSGDKTSAIWTQNALSSQLGLRPTLKVSSKSNGTGTTRQVDINFVYPSKYTDSTTGLDKLLGNVAFKGTLFLPVELTTTVWDEAFTQLGNLLVSTLLREVAETGFAPT